MYCKYCGKEVLDNAVVCPTCGVQIRELTHGESRVSVKSGVATYCKYCGKEVLENAVICPTCGVQIKDLVTAEEAKPPKNGIAIAGFVCSFFIPLLGWIFGGVGLSRAIKRDNKGIWFSIAALLISTFNFLLGFAIAMA